MVIAWLEHIQTFFLMIIIIMRTKWNDEKSLIRHSSDIRHTTESGQWASNANTLFSLISFDHNSSGNDFSITEIKWFNTRSLMLTESSTFRFPYSQSTGTRSSSFAHLVRSQPFYTWQTSTNLPSTSATAKFKSLHTHTTHLKQCDVNRLTNINSIASSVLEPNRKSMTTV